MTKGINKTGVIGIMAIAMMLSLAVHSSAFAKEDDNESSNDHGQIELTQQRNDNESKGNEDVMKGEAAQLRVEPSGEFKASGVVVNTNSGGVLNVKLFGINFNINTVNAHIEGGATTTVVSDLAVGDKLSIAGTIDPTTGVISAKQIVDRTLESRRTGDVRSRIAELMRMVEQLQEQLRQMAR